MTKSRNIRWILAAAAVMLGSAAHSQEWPTRPIKWVVPYLPGTAPDTTVRVVADAMRGILKQSVVVENRAGAAGNIGAQQVARAPADGYTWIYSATTMATSMRMYKNPGYDALKDFRHVGRISRSDLLLVVPPGSEIRSLKLLIEKLRQNPGKLNYGSGGIGTPAHMGTELLLNAAGAEALHVPFKGASETANALIGKQIDFGLTIFSVSLPHVQAGRLTALAVTAPTRNPRLPDVPTLAEAGIPGVTLVSFGGLSVPAGTPDRLVIRLNEVLNRALERPEVRAKVESLGGAIAPSTPEQYVEDLKAEIALTERMMRAAKLEPQ